MYFLFRLPYWAGHDWKARTCRWNLNVVLVLLSSDIGTMSGWWAPQYCLGRFVGPHYIEREANVTVNYDLRHIKILAWRPLTTWLRRRHVQCTCTRSVYDLRTTVTSYGVWTSRTAIDVNSATRHVVTPYYWRVWVPGRTAAFKSAGDDASIYRERCSGRTDKSHHRCVSIEGDDGRVQPQQPACPSYRLTDKSAVGDGNVMRRLVYNATSMASGAGAP